MESNQMSSINREDIHIIARHSNIEEPEVAKILKQNVYNDTEAWKKFLRLFLLSLCVSFTLAGIIFFFAYNWAGMHKFARIGIIQGLITLVTLLSLIPKFSLTVRNTLLTGASILIGVLFAVFGQVYQTGANAYDFFLAWTVCITLWVLLSNFSPLWLIYLALINTVIILYSQQVARSWEEMDLMTILTSLNAVILISALLLNDKGKDFIMPLWFTNTIALAVASFATLGMIFVIFDSYHPLKIGFMLITAILYAAGTRYGVVNKRAFYLSIIPFSLIIIISAVMLKISDGELMLLLTSIFIIASVTFLIMRLINLQKKWTNDEAE